MMYFSVLSKKKKLRWVDQRKDGNYWNSKQRHLRTLFCAVSVKDPGLYLWLSTFSTTKTFEFFFSFLEVINFRSDGMTSLVWIKFFWFFVFCDPYKLTPETIYIDSSDSLACRRYRWGDEKGRKWIWQFRWRPEDQQDGFWDKQDIQWKTGNHGTNSRRGCQHKR